MDDSARTDLLARVDPAWRAFRDGVEMAQRYGLERSTPAGYGWVEAVVAGNSWDHYPEHLEELVAIGAAKA